MFRLLSSAASLALLSSAAIAADLPLPPEPIPVAVPVFTWTGFYAGVQGGFAWGDVDADFSNGAPSLDYDADGFIGGGHVGAAYQWNWLVLGVEGDIEWTDLDGSAGSAAGITSENSIDVNFQASARGRLGLAFDRFQVYGTGGGAFADVDVTGGPLGGPDGNFSDDSWGWTAGAGAEYAVTDHVVAGLEYRFTDFGDFSGNLAPPFPGVTKTDSLETHAIRGRVGWKFP
jgi:outer membrane immunogenic protein